MDANYIEYDRLVQERTKYSKTNHILHLLLTLLTGGLWIIPWAMVAASNSSKRKEVERKIEKLAKRIG